MRAFLCLLILAVLAVPSPAQVQHSFPALDTDNVLTGKNQFTLGAQLGPVSFSSLTTTPSQNNGTIIYCTDCVAQNPCAGSGTGALAERINGAWACTVTGGSLSGSGTAFQLPRWITSSTLGNSTFFAESNASPAAFICNGVSPTCTGASAILQGAAGGGTNFTSEGNFIVETDNSGSGIFLRHGSAGTVAINDSKLATTPKLQLYGGSSGISLITTDASNAGTTFNVNNVAIGCGTTTTCSPSRPNNPRMLWGRVALSGGTATVGSISPAFSTVNSSECAAEDKTAAANPANAVIASTSSITVTGTGTDVIAYVCLGN